MEVDFGNLVGESAAVADMEDLVAAERDLVEEWYAESEGTLGQAWI